MRILIAVTGSIAAYKIPSIVGHYVNKNHQVKVMMTEAAKQFITPLTFSALSRNPVYGEHNRFANDGHIHHIELAQWANIIVIAPATFNTISKLKYNIADNLVMSTIAAFKGDILIFSAMNTKMWENLTEDSLELNSKFRSNHEFGYEFRTFHLYPPASGKLACGAEGLGKLLSIEEIIKHIDDEL